MTPFICAEISKNWHAGDSGDPSLLAQTFEALIERNRRRGYRLHSFQLHRLIVEPGRMNETIIAVFERTSTPIRIGRTAAAATDLDAVGTEGGKASVETR